MSADAGTSGVGGGLSVPLWPGEAPGETGEIGEEGDTTPPAPGVRPEEHIVRLGNVARPALTVYPAAGAQGTAVLVCPGGGYHILAMQHEGIEVCQWLNALGVTAILLKYRVPARAGIPRYMAALQDAQRAFGLVRHHAAAWGIDPARIGVLGFSAGAHLSAVLASTPERVYPVVDAADRESCRPDFLQLIYPAYLIREEDPLQLAPEVRVDSGTPPAFLVMTQDDPIRVENAFVYAQALHRAGVPVELHVYPTGGHGYGLRPSAHPVCRWPELAAVWMRALGVL
ncbi:MAG: alpha/beta hydrolase [Chloroherpetonaceae bacterium]|nr:alpha/beta hydrolase [Chthonomonadaceae bacterium]MDW8207893.1 alpha/beta hydrolase [Chloroherpetonaceae bacterium]